MDRLQTWPIQHWSRRWRHLHPPPLSHYRQTTANFSTKSPPDCTLLYMLRVFRDKLSATNSFLPVSLLLDSALTKACLSYRIKSSRFMAHVHSARRRLSQERLSPDLHQTYVSTPYATTNSTFILFNSLHRNFSLKLFLELYIFRSVIKMFFLKSLIYFTA